MAVDGNWNLTMSTPMGERKATLTLLASGGTLTGAFGTNARGDLVGAYVDAAGRTHGFLAQSTR